LASSLIEDKSIRKGALYFGHALGEPAGRQMKWASTSGVLTNMLLHARRLIDPMRRIDRVIVVAAQGNP